MTAPPPAEQSDLAQLYQDLAPTSLPLTRLDRYDGGGFGVSLSAFTPEDVSLIIQVYSAVKKMYDLWLYMSDAPNYDLLKTQMIAQCGSDHFIATAQSIGAATYALGKTDPTLRKVIHDIRGGALAVLTGYATMIKRLDPEVDDIPEYVRDAILMARDHAKLMRNAIVDLDPVVREADENVKVHFIDDFVDKWDGALFRIADKTVRIGVNCSFDGSVTNRCLETSAIDRILYNYISNAARFTTDQTVTMTIFPIENFVVRWVVENSVTSDQQNWLNQATGGDLTKLFQGGLTRGGHGIGLSSCTDFVAASFGVTPTSALEQHYLGAKLLGERYYTWFHWPVYQPASTDPICECGA